MSRFCATQCEQYIPKISISGSLCKQGRLCSNSLTKCICCLSARVKLWTLLKHFSLIKCIFKYYDLDFYCFCTLSCQFNIGDICTFTHFVGFVFLCNLDFCFWNPFIFNWVSIYDFFDVTEVLRIKECSPIPLSYLLNSIHLALCSKSVSSIWTKTSSRLHSMLWSCIFKIGIMHQL